MIRMHKLLLRSKELNTETVAAFVLGMESGQCGLRVFTECLFKNAAEFVDLFSRRK